MEKQLSPEEQEELKKKLENMSPEELREFQKKQCIFCHIVSGRVSAKKVFEDEKTLGILDINPANPGHILLLPKEHHMIMPQLPEDELEHIFVITKQLSNALLKSLDVRGTNIIVANGPAAGQRAQHFMIHIIPRKEGDGINFDVPSREQTDLDGVAQKIMSKLNSLLGIKDVQVEKDAIDLLKSNINKKEEIAAPPTNKSKESEDNNTSDGGDPNDDNGPNDDKSNDDTDDDDKQDGDKDDKRDDDDSGGDKDGEGLDLDAISRVLNG